MIRVQVARSPPKLPAEIAGRAMLRAPAWSASRSAARTALVNKRTKVSESTEPATGPTA